MPCNPLLHLVAAGKQSVALTEGLWLGYINRIQYSGWWSQRGVRLKGYAEPSTLSMRRPWIYAYDSPNAQHHG
eukprot:1139055-Pelagomonas_calceolata.AAC.1